MGEEGGQDVDWWNIHLSRYNRAAGKGISVRGRPSGATARWTDTGERPLGVELGLDSDGLCRGWAGQAGPEVGKRGAGSRHLVPSLVPLLLGLGFSCLCGLSRGERGSGPGTAHGDPAVREQLHWATRLLKRWKQPNV